VIEWDIEIARSENEINRVISVRWWPTRRKNRGLKDADLIDTTRLDSTQWTQATVYHALAYHICPKLTQFAPDRDKFQIMMEYYRGRFEHEMDLILREGVQYDLDDDGVVESSESKSVTPLRLVR
jgi:hypothetical protein